MDNNNRRLVYAWQRYGPHGSTVLTQAVEAGTQNTLLTPAQRKRVRRHEFTEPGQHRQAQRARRRDRIARRLAHLARFAPAEEDKVAVSVPEAVLHSPTARQSLWMIRHQAQKPTFSSAAKVPSAQKSTVRQKVGD